MWIQVKSGRSTRSYWTNSKTWMSGKWGINLSYTTMSELRQDFWWWKNCESPILLRRWRTVCDRISSRILVGSLSLTCITSATLARSDWLKSTITKWSSASDSSTKVSPISCPCSRNWLSLRRRDTRLDIRLLCSVAALLSVNIT